MIAWLTSPLLFGPPILSMAITIWIVKWMMSGATKFRLIKTVTIYASVAAIFALLYYWSVSNGPPPREHMEEVAPFFVTLIWIFLAPVVFGIGYAVFLREKVYPPLVSEAGK